MKKKQKKYVDPKTRMKRAAVVGAISLIILIAAVVLAFVLNPKDSDDTSSEQTSSEPSESFVISEPEESSEPSGDEDPAPMVLTAEQIPEKTNTTSVLVTGAENASLGKFFGYDGELPVIADVSCTDDGRCIALVVYAAEETDGGTSLDCQYWEVNLSSGTFGNAATGEWTPYSYNRNVWNTDGVFALEYENAAEKRGPYVLYYEKDGNKTILQYGEEADVYARIIRQNSDYAILSLNHDDESEYVVISSSGEVVSELGWDADISVNAPLMFYGDYLPFKTDTDDDYVYDTISMLNLKNGERTELWTIGNCERWSYGADGKLLAVFGDESNKNVLHYCTMKDFTNGGSQIWSLEADSPIAKAEVTGGAIWALTEGEVRTAYFLYHENTYDSIMGMIVNDISEDAVLVAGEGMLAILQSGTLTVCAVPGA